MKEDQESGTNRKESLKSWKLQERGGEPPEPSDKEKINRVYRLASEWAQRMEKSRISEYTELLYSPWRLIWLNVLAGTARGVGIAIGFTFFAATIIYVLQVLGALNLPIIGDYIADIVRIVQHQLELNTY
ncbi:DUF5665 domain-containing protein [Paenibacillus sp. URB8-2]|uniref:DUF5665 domain-containing protein n=1 Tax=Paenibacillus sp. URB8-2 TaxID=2741301 RepID=UPI0015C205B0|nr:DUF5665 domain-containing protein [Paenibacillus sp. URB8-2]BCG60221.1 hypothetical protein PUR_36460 [Paenibacillus sp. URB8-2]